MKRCSLLFLAALGSIAGARAQTPAPLPAAPSSGKPAPALAVSAAPTSVAALTPATPPAGSMPATLPTAPESPLGGGPRITWSEVRVNGPFIAITFDDGPHPTLTPQLLDMLKQRGIHATFFVLGSLVKDHPEIVRRALAEGHEIANHSWDHPNLGKMSEEAVRSQINRTKEAINAATGGKASDLMRPPYGSLTSAQRRWMHDDLGYKIMLWSVDPFDWKRPGPEAITHRIVEGTHSGGIVLVHDIHPGSVAAMPATLDGLLAKGFKFVTVSELLAMELPPEPKKTAALTGAGVQPTPRRTLAPGVPEKITGTEPGAEPAPAPAAASPSPTPKRRR